MKCVVLLGFSTTGKSSILCDFRKSCGGAIDTLDSDREVSRPYGGHIYNVFLHHRAGSDTKPALDVIETRERKFLVSLTESVTPTAMPLLLASGPFLPIRKFEWQRFVERVKPQFFYLQKNPEDVRDGLLERRRKHLEDSQLSARPGFGCWDQDVTTKYHDGSWVEIDHNQALENVRGLMDTMVANYYERLANQTFTWQERQTEAGKKKLITAICQELGIPSSDNF